MRFGQTIARSVVLSSFSRERVRAPGSLNAQTVLREEFMIAFSQMIGNREDEVPRRPSGALTP